MLRLEIGLALLDKVGCGRYFPTVRSYLDSIYVCVVERFNHGFVRLSREFLLYKYVLH